MALTVWALWLLATPFLRWPVRRTGLLVALLLTWGYFTLIRLDGIDGTMTATLQWRWAPKAEDKYQAEAAGKPAPAAAPAEAVTLQPGDWPGFRGPERDGRLHGRPHRDRLDPAPAATDLAASRRPRLGFVRRGRQPPLHAGAARGRRGGGLL